VNACSIDPGTVVDQSPNVYALSEVRTESLEIPMLRKITLLLIPLAFVLQGCGSSDLPTVPPAPPPETVKAAPAGPSTIPKDVLQRMKGSGGRTIDKAGKSGAQEAN